MSKSLSVTSLVLSVILSGAQLAVATTGPAGCLRDVRRTFVECGASCREDLQSAKDSCINKDHACVEGCRAGRAACVDASGLRVAINACDDTLAAARAICRDTTTAGSTERDLCIDAAQQVAFQCRDSARETAAPAIAACRAAFRSCVNVCPPGTGSVAENPRLCRRDANRAYGTCQRTCREDLQVGRDACLHRDHACLEVCRDGRATCDKPVRDLLKTALAACAATRDAAIATCHSLYADGSTELDQCIDNAQVAAFTCGDQARETARPSFLSCRGQFRDCALACPATTP